VRARSEQTNKITAYKSRRADLAHAVVGDGANWLALTARVGGGAVSQPALSVTIQ